MLTFFYISWRICCWPLSEAGIRAVIFGHLLVAIPEIVIKDSPAHYKDPSLLFPSLCCSRVPCGCTGWASTGCQFRSSSLASWQVQVQPKKGEEGKQRDLSFYPFCLFLECCSVPALLCSKEEVRSMKWLWGERLKSRHPFGHRSLTSSWEWHILVLPNIPNDEICAQASVNAGFCSGDAQHK